MFLVRSISPGKSWGLLGVEDSCEKKKLLYFQTLNMSENIESIKVEENMIWTVERPDFSHLQEWRSPGVFFIQKARLLSESSIFLDKIVSLCNSNMILFLKYFLLISKQVLLDGEYRGVRKFSKQRFLLLSILLAL